VILWGRGGLLRRKKQLTVHPGMLTKKEGLLRGAVKQASMRLITLSSKRGHQSGGRKKSFPESPLLFAGGQKKTRGPFNVDANARILS